MSAEMENSIELEKYQGKAKTVEILSEDRVRIIFRDDITAGDGAKKDTIPGKGGANRRTGVCTSPGGLSSREVALPGSS